MERHIKQQHPQHWCQKPRGSRRNHAATVPVIAPQFRSSNENDDSESENKLEIDDERCGMEENQQNGNGTLQIKDKNSRLANSHISENCQNNEDMENSGDEGEEEEEEGFEVGSDNGEDGSLIIDEPSTSSTGNGQEDLASVSKLLNTASAQSFQKVSFFSIVKYQVKVGYSRKNNGIISITLKCAMLYPKLCILNFPALGHCSAVRVI